jgi:uncharacterized protein (DUF1330 family)
LPLPELASVMTADLIAVVCGLANNSQTLIRQTKTLNRCEEENEMPAYMIFTREGPITDQAEMDTYSAANQANGPTYFEKFKIKPLAAYGALETFEGEAPDGVVLLEFPTAEDARGWYNSPEYQSAMAHRLKGSTYRVTLVEGV